MKLNKLLHNARNSCQPSAIALLASVFFASGAGAAGFGELTLHSRIGENLLAEVPILGNGKELADPNCYALSPNPGSDLPVITNARLRLTHNKDSYRLLIVGSRPIAEPVFAISVRINCGFDLRHDYVLMPDAPLPLAELIESAAPAQGNRSRDLETAADRPAPAKKKQRAKAGKRNNNQASLGRHQSGTTMSRTASQDWPAGDRLTLSAAPLELRPGESAAPANAKEIEERLLKMETTLHTLNQEIETLNTSLQLSTEMQSAKQDLQLAQSAQPTLASAITPRDASDGWLELLVSSLLGGSLAIGAAAYLGRHKQTNRPII